MKNQKFKKKFGLLLFLFLAAGHVLASGRPNPLGIWGAKLINTDEPGRNDRLLLKIEKVSGGHLRVSGRDLDQYGGGTDYVFDQVSWSRGTLKAASNFLDLDVTLGPSGTLSGNLETKQDKKTYQVIFDRALNYTVPRNGPKGESVTEYTYQVPQTLLDGWEVGGLRESGLDPVTLQAGVEKILQGAYPFMESLLVSRHGQLVLDEYFKGLAPEDCHQLQSATKSILSLLFGIAQDQGLVNTDDRIYDIYPEYRSKPGWTRDKNSIRLKDLLTMTSGLDCDDWVPAKNRQDAMWKSTNWLDFIFSIPLSFKPGEHFAYCNDCMELLGNVVVRKSGMTIPDFAQKYLYDPLGIQGRHWVTGPDGIDEVAGSEWLRPRDMAKLGQLLLQEGNWRGRQVISKKWVKESTSQKVSPLWSGGWGYGYLWWRQEMLMGKRTTPVFFAAGLGGQLIFVVPEFDLVCVMTGDHYKGETITDNPSVEFFKTYVLSALK